MLLRFCLRFIPAQLLDRGACCLMIRCDMKVLYVIVLAAAVGSSATVTPSNECAYLSGSFPGGILNSASIPSVNSGCVDAINALTLAASVAPTGYPDTKYYQSVCSSTCQSFYNLYSSCYSPQQANAFLGQYCGSYNATRVCNLP